jgi:hypothetical protein
MGLRTPITLAVLQPGYLPWLGFFDQQRRADVFVYYDDVQFDKHGWRNRNRIKSPSGPHWLTVPVRHGGLDRPKILDIQIDAGVPWARKHLQSIRHFYSKAPHLATYIPWLEQLLLQPWERLIDLDLAVARQLGSWLGIQPTVARSSELGIQGERSERLVKLCEYFGASRYLSGSAARAYLDTALFRRHGIEVEWQDYEHPVYPQQHGEFLPNLSALDLLLNCGDLSPRVLLAGVGQHLTGRVLS